MAKSLLVELGFNVNKGSVTESISGIGRITSSINGLRRTVRLLSTGFGFKSLASGVSDISGSIKNAVMKSYNMAEEFSNVGDRIAKTSRLVGLSVREYQALSSAAQHAGLATEEMDSALMKFNINLGKARSGDKTSLKMFDAILGGAKISDFKDRASLIAAIADGYKKLGSAEQKAFVSSSLFGKSGIKMSELLSGGGAEIKKMIDEFESRGGGFSEEGAAAAERFNDELQNVRETISSLKISVAQELFPTFIDIFKEIQSFVKENRQELLPVVREIFAYSADLAKSILPKIPMILNTVLAVVKGISPEVLVLGVSFVSILPAIGKIVFGLVSMLPLIGKAVAFAKFALTYVHGLIIGAKMLAALIGGPVLGTIGLVVAGVVSWGIAIKSIYDNLNLVPDALAWIGTTIKESFVFLGKLLYSLFIDPFLNFFKSIPGAVSSLVDGFFNGFKAIGDMVFDLGGKIYDSIVGSVKSAWSAAKGILGSIPVVGKMFKHDAPVENGPSSESLGSSVAQVVRESYSTTTTSRFAVDFKNMPRGVQVTPPAQGDFDWSRGYVLGGA